MMLSSASSSRSLSTLDSTNEKGNGAGGATVTEEAAEVEAAATEEEDDAELADVIVPFVVAAILENICACDRDEGT